MSLADTTASCFPRAIAARVVSHLEGDELLAEVGSRPPKSRGDGAARNAEKRCNLGPGQPIDRGENEDRSQRRGRSFDDAVESQARLLPFDQRFGRITVSTVLG